MAKYLLSVHSVGGDVRDPMTDEEMQEFMQRVGVLEGEMKSAGAWVFGGRLHDPDTASAGGAHPPTARRPLDQGGRKILPGG